MGVGRPRREEAAAAHEEAAEPGRAELAALGTAALLRSYV